MILLNLLEIRELHASVAGKPILKGVNLVVERGKVHAIMGPNGSGKSTLGNVLMGSPKCLVTKGEVLFLGENLLEMTPNQRARKGVFLGFQNPIEVHGLKFFSFLKRAVESLKQEKQSVAAFKKTFDEKALELLLPSDLVNRDVNYGFSGGEKKRSEAFQLGVLNPSLALLDEIDSGLDVDTLKLTASRICEWQKNTGASVVFMTHYKRILDYAKPDFVHKMIDGRIVESGGFELAEEIDSTGYGATATTAAFEESGAQKEEFYTSLLKLNKEKALRQDSNKIDLKVV